jgi:hypothetical protein
VEDEKRHIGGCAFTYEIGTCELQSRRIWQVKAREKAIVASMDGTTETLSPCLRLLIEILLGEAITANSDIAALRDIEKRQTKIKS